MINLFGAIVAAFVGDTAGKGDAVDQHRGDAAQGKEKGRAVSPQRKARRKAERLR